MSRSARALLGIGALVAVVLALLAVRHQAGVEQLPGRQEYDAFTGMVAAVLEVTAGLAAVATLGFLCAAIVMRPTVGPGDEKSIRVGKRIEHHPVTTSARRWTVAAGRTGQIWFAAALFAVPFSAATQMGVPVGYALAGISDFLVGSQVAQAWLVQAVIALIVTLVAYLARSVGALVVAAYLGLLGLLPVVVNGHVSVGLHHDFATDAAILAAIAGTVWFAVAFAVNATGLGPHAGQRLGRYQQLAGPAWLVVAIGGSVMAWQALAGRLPWQEPYGWVLIGQAAVMLVLALLWFLRGGLKPHSGAFGYRLIAVDLALIAVLIGLQVAALQITPPRWEIPQSIQVNYLGYTVNEAPTLASAILPGRPNLLFAVGAVVALVGYLWAVRTVRRRGDDWPIHRTVMWVIGWILMLGVTVTGLWKYSGAAFSYHMIVHMTVNMLAPVLLVMGAPITLALRYFTPHRARDLPGPREVLNATLSWKPLEIFLHPLAVWVYFVGSFYLLYYTSLFDIMMRYHWAHQFMTVHFLITGLLFYGLVIGEDRPPKPLPHVGKLGFVFAAMPFHAFFAVGVMSSMTLIGATFYPTLDVPWVPDLMADQELGGAITWATGEIPMVIVVLSLVVQWLRQDKRDAKRLDRAQDTGLDDSYDAYNEMLARFAQQDRLDRAERDQRGKP
ncbi:MAG: cytochrome c oxidase assembly protein [Propionibacterium sp.]|nr:cytochrome c oxidase assembly protein [Propionibacterium sp.]